MNTPSSVNAVSHSYTPFEPVKTYIVAGTTEYIATAFTDSSIHWNDEANAYDGDWGTAAYYDIGKFSTADAFPSAYASGFDSGASGSGTITQVDIVVRHAITGLDSSDQWAISLDVGAAQGTDLQALTTANYALNNQTFTDVTEPNGGGWSWAEIQAAQIHFEEDKVGGGDKADWSIYEIAFIITSEDAGIPYEKDMTEGVSAVDVETNAADFDRSYTESVSAADVQTNVADFVRNLVESIGVVGVLTTLRGREKDLVETITAADVMTRNGTFVRDWVETITASDSIAKGIGLNMTEAVSVADIGTFAKLIQKNLVETVTASDVKTTAAGYVRNRIESISAIDAQSNAAAYVRDFVEAITAADSIEASKAIAKNMIETITASDVRTTAVDYARNLTETVSVVDVQTNAAAYALELVEAITVSDVRDIVKNPSGGEDYEKNLTEGIGVSVELATVPPVIGSLFYQLFLSNNMWGYLGPIAVVIGGYFAMKKDTSLGVIWFVVECVIMAQYFALVEATPNYWWQIIILLLGGVLCLIPALMDR